MRGLFPWRGANGTTSTRLRDANGITTPSRGANGATTSPDVVIVPHNYGCRRGCRHCPCRRQGRLRRRRRRARTHQRNRAACGRRRAWTGLSPRGCLCEANMDASDHSGVYSSVRLVSTPAHGVCSCVPSHVTARPFGKARTCSHDRPWLEDVLVGFAWGNGFKAIHTPVNVGRFAFVLVDKLLDLAFAPIRA